MVHSPQVPTPKNKDSHVATKNLRCGSTRMVQVQQRDETIGDLEFIGYALTKLQQPTSVLRCLQNVQDIEG